MLCNSSFDVAAAFMGVAKCRKHAELSSHSSAVPCMARVMLFNASNACNAQNTRKLYDIGTADVVAGVY